VATAPISGDTPGNSAVTEIGAIVASSDPRDWGEVTAARPPVAHAATDSVPTVEGGTAAGAWPRLGAHRTVVGVVPVAAVDKDIAQRRAAVRRLITSAGLADVEQLERLARNRLGNGAIVADIDPVEPKLPSPMAGARPIRHEHALVAAETGHILHDQVLHGAATLRMNDVAVWPGPSPADPTDVRILNDEAAPVPVGPNGIGGSCIDVDEHAVDERRPACHTDIDDGLLTVAVDDMAATDPDISSLVDGNTASARPISR